MLKYVLEVVKQNLLSSPPPEIRVFFSIFNINFKKIFSRKSYFFAN
jgi:hypothetical protein